MLYIVAMWGAGVSQGLLWLSVDEIGELSFSFKDIMASMQPFYALRLIAGLIFLAGTCLMAYNLFKTLVGRKAVVVKAPPVDPAYAIGKEAAV
jgi:cytochrome c oxidase cbb3-type subunit 1